MAGKAKPGFYIAVVVVILGLVGFAYYRYTSPPSSAPPTAIDATSKSTETKADELEGKLAASVEIPQAYPNQVRLLTSNRNLLVVADILIVNAGFAKQHPRIVKGLVEGILLGVEEMRTDPERTVRVVAKAFATTPEEMRGLLQDVHLSNHAENLLFFSPEPGQIGSFRDLYYSAVYAYGKEVIKNAVPPEKLVNRTYLEELAKDGLFQGQRVTLGPSKNAEKTEILERDPLLTKQIRFYFEPNSTELDVRDMTNQQALRT